MSENGLVEKAKALAYRAHAGQVDKAGRPYIEHVARVAKAVRGDDDAEAVAWLHDVLEDVPALEDEVFSLLPRRLYGYVECLSRCSYAGERENYYSTIRKFAIPLRVKLADIADNSDPVRLAMLEPKVAKRLQAKYTKALAELLRA